MKRLTKSEISALARKIYKELNIKTQSEENKKRQKKVKDWYLDKVEKFKKTSDYKVLLKYNAYINISNIIKEPLDGTRLKNSYYVPLELNEGKLMIHCDSKVINDFNVIVTYDKIDKQIGLHQIEDEITLSQITSIDLKSLINSVKESLIKQYDL